MVRCLGVPIFWVNRISLGVPMILVNKVLALCSNDHSQLRYYLGIEPVS